MKGQIVKKTCKTLVCMLVMLSMVINPVFNRPAQSDAASSDSLRLAGSSMFHLTLTVDVNNEHSGAENKIRIYYLDYSDVYHMYYYSTVNPDHNKYIDIDYVAKKKGNNQTIEVDLPGPIHSVELYVHGSVTDAVQYYLRKIDMKVLQQMEGLGFDSEMTLWSGKMGCSVATMGSNTVYGRLYFNQNKDLPKGEKYPYIQEWRDPGTERKALLGGDYASTTTDYYEPACRDLKPFGMTAFELEELKDVYVPESSPTINKYYFNYKSGTVYDQLGIRWPEQNKNTLSINPENFCAVNSDYIGTYLIVDQRSNAKDDYQIDMVEEKNGFKSNPQTITVHTFDYDFYFVEYNGDVIEKQTHEFGDKVEPPFDAVWFCDLEDWKTTKMGPQTRYIYRFPLEGRGTEEDPFLIKSAEDWDLMTSFYDDHEKFVFRDKYFKLENDISVTTHVGKDKHRFSGHFDGNGHTLTVDYENTDDNFSCAPFAYVENFKIKDLTVAGRISGDHARSSGLIGEAYGTVTIDNCIVSAQIEGQDYTAGFVVGNDYSTTINDSQFIGQLNGNTNCGGFVACAKQKVYLNYCNFFPSASSGCKKGNTFVGSGAYYIYACHYSSQFGGKQGDYREPPSQTEIEDKAMKFQRSVMAAKDTQIKNFKGKVMAARKAGITWDKIKNSVSLKIKFSTDPDMKKNVKTKTIKLPLKKVMLKKLKKDQTYYFMIQPSIRVTNSLTGEKRVFTGKWSQVKHFTMKKK